jgi:uncharacterized protein
MHYLTRASKTQFEFKDQRRLSFYACLWDQPAHIEDDEGVYTEVIKRGAFTETLQDFEKEVTANVNHKEVSTFAQRTNGSLLLQEDPKGLFASCWIPETPLGESVIQDIKGGKLVGASVRFAPLESNRQPGLIERTKGYLVDVCLTGNPWYPQTKGEVVLRSQQFADPDKVRHLFAKCEELMRK